MTYGKLSDRCLKVFVVLLIAGVLGGFCLPHFVEAVAGGYNTPCCRHVAWCRGPGGTCFIS